MSATRGPSRLDAIRFAWVESELHEGEGVLRGAQEDIQYLFEQLETLERLHDEAVARFDAERGRREELERIVASNPASEPLS